MLCVATRRACSPPHGSPDGSTPPEDLIEGAITPDKATTTPLTTCMDECFGQVSQAFEDATSGPEAFTLVTGQLRGHFDRVDSGAGKIKLTGTFVVISVERFAW